MNWKSREWHPISSERSRSQSVTKIIGKINNSGSLGQCCIHLCIFSKCIFLLSFFLIHVHLCVLLHNFLHVQVCWPVLIIYGFMSCGISSVLTISKLLVNFIIIITEMAAWLVANGPISIGINANMMQVR